MVATLEVTLGFAKRFSIIFLAESGNTDIRPAFTFIALRTSARDPAFALKRS